MSQVAADIREMVAEQVEYRELLYQMTRRDLLLRYKQTAVGFGWAVFMPVVNTVIFVVIFTRVARIDVGVPYPVFAYCGLLAWNFTASALRFSLTSLTTNTNLVTKVYFPREVFPFSAVIVAAVDFAVGAVLLVALMTYYGLAPSLSSLAFLPLILAIHVMFTAGLALALAMANLFYRDVKYLFEVLITVGMFATSVVYPIAAVGGRTGALLQLNPMTPIIDGYRSVLLHGSVPEPGPFAAAACCALVVFAVSWIQFHRSEFQFAENV
jgi:ABC-type polysaccharide/polyol phosphate export permease